MDSKKLSLIINIGKFALAGLGLIVFILVIGGPNTDADKAIQEEFRDGAKLSMAIGYLFLIIGLGVAAILFFFVLQLISNTKRTVMSIIGIIAALLVYLVLLMIGSSDTQETLALRIPVEEGTINTTTAGLWTAIIGIAIAILVWVLSPLMGKMRK